MGSRPAKMSTRRTAHELDSPAFISVQALATLVDDRDGARRSTNSVRMRARPRRSRRSCSTTRQAASRVDGGRCSRRSAGHSTSRGATPLEQFLFRPTVNIEVWGLHRSGRQDDLAAQGGREARSAARSDMTYERALAQLRRTSRSTASAISRVNPSAATTRPIPPSTRRHPAQLAVCVARDRAGRHAAHRRQLPWYAFTAEPLRLAADTSAGPRSGAHAPDEYSSSSRRIQE